MLHRWDPNELKETLLQNENCKPVLACHEILQLLHVSAKQTVNRELVMLSSLDAI
jgi:hypothetical protein